MNGRDVRVITCEPIGGRVPVRSSSGLNRTLDVMPSAALAEILARGPITRDVADVP